MLQFIKDKIVNIWQYRFYRGIDTSLGGMLIGRYNTGGWLVSGHLLRIISVGTNHHPFFLAEFAVQLGGKKDFHAFHVGLLGFTFGRARIPNLDEDGNLVGPDIIKNYFFFKCLNHNNKQFEEII